MPPRGSGATVPKATLRVYKLALPVDELRRQLEERSYNPVPVDREGFELFVKTAVKEPKWLPVLKELATSLPDLENREASFVLLRFTDGGTYVLTGGSGHFVVQPFIDGDFGLEIACRLIPPYRVKLLTAKNPAGRIEQEESIYRGYYNYKADASNWSKVIKHLLGAVEGDDLQSGLGLPVERDKQVRIEGTAGFAIKKALTLDEIETVIAHLDDVMKREPLISPMKGFVEASKDIRANLRDELSRAIRTEYEAYLREPDTYASTALSLSYRDARQLVLASTFNLRLGRSAVSSVESLDIPTLFHELNEHGWTVEDLSRFERIRVEGLDDDGNILFDCPLRDLLVAELTYNNQVYVLVDNRWFLAQRTFIERLDNQLGTVVVTDQSFWLPEWPTNGGKPVSEDEYLLKGPVTTCNGLCVLHRKHVVVTDPRDKAEICDILDTRHDHPRLVFVKRGIAAQVRELARQAVDSFELLLAHEDFRRRAFSKVAQHCGNATGKSDVSRWGAILAVVDHVPQRLPGQPLSVRMTTLAKMEVVKAIQELRGHGLSPVFLYEITMPPVGSSTEEKVGSRQVSAA